jgi:hypothetical protein
VDPFGKVTKSNPDLGQAIDEVHKFSKESIQGSKSGSFVSIWRLTASILSDLYRTNSGCKIAIVGLFIK